MTHKKPTEGEALVYQVHLDLSTKTLTLVTTAIRKHRQQVRSRWRKLPDLSIALIVLAYLRHDQRPARLATAYGVSHHTVRRWIRETVTTLAGQAPRLDRALASHSTTHPEHPNDPDHPDHAYRLLLFDGTCLPVTRARRGSTRDHRRYCGKHRAHHLRVLTITDLDGRLLWISAATGARTSETTHAKQLRLPTHLRHHHLMIITDRAHTQLDDDPTNPTVIHGRRANRHHKLTPAEKLVNHLINADRAPVEHAHAHLKNWRILTRLRPGWTQNHATTLLRALLTLTNTETHR